MALTAEQRARHAQDGFLILEGFVPPAECDALAARAEAPVAAFEPKTVAVFSAREVRLIQARRHSMGPVFHDVIACERRGV